MEGNSLADYFANLIFSFVGKNNLTFANIQKVPSAHKTLIRIEKNQISNLRIKRYQNRNYRFHTTTQEQQQQHKQHNNSTTITQIQQ